MANAHRVEGTSLNTVVAIATCRNDFKHDMEEDCDADEDEGDQHSGAAAIGVNPLGIDSDALLASCMDLAAIDISACPEIDESAKSKSTASDASTSASGGDGASSCCVRADELVASALMFAGGSTKRCSGNMLFINAIQADEEDHQDEQEQEREDNIPTCG